MLWLPQAADKKGGMQLKNRCAKKARRPNKCFLCPSHINSRRSRQKCTKDVTDAKNESSRTKFVVSKVQERTRSYAKSSGMSLSILPLKNKNAKRNIFFNAKGNSPRVA
jgi:hypothetical protein